MMQHLRLLCLVFSMAGPLTLAAQHEVSLPDPSSKLPFLPARSSQEGTVIPDARSKGLDSPGTPGQEARMDWWREARFGMFIHWGLYAVPAGEWKGKTGYGEWIRTSAEIPLEVYDQFVPKFNPERFDAGAWVKMARDAGMKYIVITSKHHDGFCMFDTKQTDYNIMNTPFKRDPMKELAAACKKYGLKLCFYHSIMDWHHPDYLPRRDWEKSRSAKEADFDRYVAYMKAQLKELLTNYGDIGVLWFDGEWESTWNEHYGKEIYHYVKSLQPSILVNNRVGAGRLDMEGLTKEGAFGGDFGTPEQQIPSTGMPGVDWETCMTMNDHWGYNKSDRNFKPAGEIIRMLSDIASKGGNYLLNVGPTAEGLIPPESVERLATIGKWMTMNGESIYGTQASPFKQLDWGRCTQKTSASGTVLYLHVFDWPANGTLELPGVLNIPGNAFILADPAGKPLEAIRKEDAIVISVPSKAPDSVDCVIAITLRGKLDVTSPPEFKTEFDTFIDSLPVSLFSYRENVDILYDSGETEPSVTSEAYAGPVMLRETTTLNARCFRDGMPVSGTASRLFRKVEPLKAVSPPPTPDGKEHQFREGLRYRYFEGTWDSLPDFDSLKPVKEGAVPDFIFIPRNQDEHFGFEYSGYVIIPETAVYAFFTSSDDGSRLWIDDILVADNDGLHAMQERHGNIPLEKGLHRIRVEFFERTGGDGLEVRVKSQSLPKTILPPSWLRY